MQGVLQVVWRVSPLGFPRVWRYCDHCKKRRPFDCSGKFRSNAQKKRLDVWLIYHCGHCGQSWNLPIHERRRISDLDPAQVHAFAENAEPLLRQHACNVDRLRGHADRVESASAVAVEKVVLGGTRESARLLAVTIALAAPCALRLDRLLARELTLSRSRVRSLNQAGMLRLAPSGKAVLRQAVRDRQQVGLHLKGPEAPAAEVLRAACGLGGEDAPQSWCSSSETKAAE